MGFIASIFKLLFLMILAYVVYNIIMFIIRIFIHANRTSDGKKSDDRGRNNQNRGNVIELDKDQYKVE
jgi:Na+-transporting methylmalonyl-CoA/oxaloacetate decarboxylase gamma subunit